MNIASTLISSLMPMFVMIFSGLLIVAAFKLYRPIITGWFGERKVRNILDGLDPKKYRCFHDVLLPIDGETTQIDHILFAGDRCFVIETKAHDGWIFGSTHDKTWTQMLNKHSKFRFQNPIRQNYKHTLAVRNFVEGLTVTGIVVFTRGTFKSDRIDAVLYPKELKSFLLDNAKVESFNNRDAAESLMRAMIVEKSAHRAHVRRLQAKYGGRWRVPVANSFLIVALCLYLVGPETETVTKSSAPANQTVVPNKFRVPQKYSLRPAVEKRVQKKDDIQKDNKPLPAIAGFTAGKVIVIESGEYNVLNVGDKTKSGWQLVKADAKSATFSDPFGVKTRIQIR
ncbi:MAG: nuclease-related domain-containing protein [Mariprofundaceae bacterium]|nr:nuclease-related domain-containing protein [Mariprofundaceae bacterium]